MTKETVWTAEFYDRFFGRRGRPVGGEAPEPLDKNKGRLHAAELSHPNAYLCGVCGAEYFHENLQKTCEQIPVEESVLARGTVFKCEDDLLAILCDSTCIKQTHLREYEIARTGISHKEGIWMMVPKVTVYAKYLSYAKPVSDEEFAKVNETLQFHLKDLPPYSANLPHIVKLRELTLVPLK